jgi:hypothetical protein
MLVNNQENVTSNRYLQFFLVLILICVSIFGAPFSLYLANSGRYLVIAEKIAAPSLFPHDPVMTAIARFKNVFYPGIGFIIKALHLNLTNIYPLMFFIYMIVKAALVLTIWKLAAEFKKSILFFVLFMTWACFPQTSPIGSEFSFANQILHNNFAELFCLLSLVFFLRKKYTLFWIGNAIALFMHSIIALDFLLCVIPAFIFLNEKAELKKQIPGILIFLAGFLAYFIWMTPPPFNSADAQIFLNTKLQKPEISPFSQKFINWILIACNFSIVFMLYYLSGTRTKNEKLIFFSVISGAVIGLVLGLVAMATHIVSLAQFQPMRVYTWVNVFIFFLMTYYLSKLIIKRSFLALLIIAYIGFLMMQSPFAYLIFPFLFVMLLTDIYYGRILKRNKPPILDKMIIIGFGLLIFGIIGLWLISNMIPIKYFRSPVPLALAGALALGLIFWLRIKTYKLFLIFIVWVAVLFGTSFRHYLYYYGSGDKKWGLDSYQPRVNDDLMTTLKWIAENTDTTSKFILAGRFENFSAGSLRSGIGRSFSSLAWVSPQTYIQTEKEAELVMTAYNKSDKTWDLNKLKNLSVKWNSRYVITENEDLNPKIPPVFSKDKFKVFDLNMADSTKKNIE